jgi:hypothetical protein
MKLDCNILTKTDNHSEDLTRLFYGAKDPLVMCGFHASKLTKADWAKLNESKESK